MMNGVYMEEYKLVYQKAKKYVLNKIGTLKYPQGHPFLTYPKTPESMFMEILILVKALLGEKTKTIDSILVKCKAVESGKFNYYRYLEGLDEVLILYYVLVKTLGKVTQVIYEPHGFIDNDKTLEYSFYFHNAEECIVNFEVKTMLCDPFKKEESLSLKDGTILIKKLVKDDDGEFQEIKTKFPGAVELEKSTYYTPFKRNIKKIIEKYDGEKMLPCRMINIGVICVHLSTSLEEFYTYLFHKKKGIYSEIDWGNLDVLVLLSADAKNDLKLENLYEMGYIKTVLLNDDEFVKSYLNLMKLDQYISTGRKVLAEVFEQAQQCYGIYKIMNREGFINIIPYDSTEESIDAYVEYLKGTAVRYGDDKEKN